MTKAEMTALIRKALQQKMSTTGAVLKKTNTTSDGSGKISVEVETEQKTLQPSDEEIQQTAEMLAEVLYTVFGELEIVTNAAGKVSGSLVETTGTGKISLS